MKFVEPWLDQHNSTLLDIYDTNDNIMDALYLFFNALFVEFWDF